MPQLEYFLASESCAIDSQTNRVSIFNVLEEIQAAGFPTLMPGVVAMAVWNAEPGDEQRDFQAVFLVSGPGDEEPRRFPVNFRIPEARARTLIQIVGYPVNGPGQLRFEVEIDGEHKASHTATISLRVPAPVH
jgi:hypothetical protein